eukprot:COSAG02_NODE_1858_length_10636_cov_6.878333_4_plen_141_part_00
MPDNRDEHQCRQRWIKLSKAQANQEKDHDALPSLVAMPTVQRLDEQGCQAEAAAAAPASDADLACRFVFDSIVVIGTKDSDEVVAQESHHQNREHQQKRKKTGGWTWDNRGTICTQYHRAPEKSEQGEETVIQEQNPLAR